MILKLENLGQLSQVLKPDFGQLQTGQIVERVGGIDFGVVGIDFEVVVDIADLGIVVDIDQEVGIDSGNLDIDFGDSEIDSENLEIDFGVPEIDYEVLEIDFGDPEIDSGDLEIDFDALETDSENPDIDFEVLDDLDIDFDPLGIDFDYPDIEDQFEDKNWVNAIEQDFELAPIVYQVQLVENQLDQRSNWANLNWATGVVNYPLVYQLD